MWLALFLTTLAHAGSWPGTGGKICFDTPKPMKNSGQDLRETYGSGLQGEEQKRREELLKAQPKKFEPPVTLEIDGKSFGELPKEKGILVTGLDVSKKHKIRIRNGKGRIDQAFSFRFENAKDPRVRIAQGEFYHIDMQVDPPPRSCPWEAR